QLVVLGEGPERERLARLARELDVPLRLPGRVPDVAAWLRRAELLVHPVRWEGFELAVLEAMLAGLPVVALRVSSLPELVGGWEVARVGRDRVVSPHAAVQLVAVEKLGPVGATLLQETVERSPPSCLAHPAGQLEVATQPDDRARERLGFARRDEKSGDAVLDELAEAADLGGDHRPDPLHRLERNHPEPLPHRGP